MTAESTAFAWLEVPSTSLGSSFSNTFTLEWPKGSGNLREYPEIDRVAWLAVAAARSKLVTGQRPLLDQLEDVLGHGGPSASRLH